MLHARLATQSAIVQFGRGDRSVFGKLVQRHMRTAQSAQ